MLKLVQGHYSFFLLRNLAVEAFWAHRLVGGGYAREGAAILLELHGGATDVGF